MTEYLFKYITKDDRVDLAIIHAPNVFYAEENFNLWYVKPLNIARYDIHELSESVKRVSL